MNIDAQYTRTLDSVPTMPAAEQAALAARYARTRDRRDADRLVLGNLRLVVKIARQLGGAHRRDMMDLIQEGNAGLAHAVKLFDPGRGAKLSTYAAWWIRAFIMRYLMDTSRMVRVSSTREGRRRFFDHTLPDADVSLDAPASSASDGAWTAGRSRLDALPDDEDDRPDVRCESDEYETRLRAAIAAFPPTLNRRERDIFEMRLLREKPARLEDVGRWHGISGERARQLEARVRDGLRTFVAGALGETERVAA